MNKLYARLVLWLIRPALVENDFRETARIRAANEYWRSLGCPGGTFQAAGKDESYWRDRGFPGGFAEAASKLNIAGAQGMRATES